MLQASFFILHFSAFLHPNTEKKDVFNKFIYIG